MLLTAAFFFLGGGVGHIELGHPPPLILKYDTPDMYHNCYDMDKLWVSVFHTFERNYKHRKAPNDEYVTSQCEVVFHLYPENENVPLTVTVNEEKAVFPLPSTAL